jgi:hypothetical protein
MMNNTDSDTIVFPPPPPSLSLSSTLSPIPSPPLSQPPSPLPEEVGAAAEEDSFIPGNFDYIKGEWDRVMLSTAYKAITITESWDVIKNFTDLFDESIKDKINIIYKKIEELGYTGHSGWSFCYTMKVMRLIADKGEKKFRDDNMEN